MVSIALVMSVVVTNLFLRKDSKRRVPSYIRRIFLRTETTGRSRMKPSMTSSTTAETENHCGVQECLGLDELSVLDEPEPSRKGNRSLRRISGGLEHPRTRRSRYLVHGFGSSREEDYEDCEEEEVGGNEEREAEAIREEWQSLAKVVDRVFFWMFFVSSVGSLTGMFLRIPP